MCRNYFLTVTYHQNVRLYHGLFITIKLYIYWCRKKHACSLLLADESMKPYTDFQADLLMNHCRCRHIIDHAIYQLCSSFIRKLIVILKSILSTFILKYRFYLFQYIPAISNSCSQLYPNCCLFRLICSTVI